ncbi:disease resistance family protein / LRR family protein [Prunus dulcis]|uniref:Disease resistance family protein / LRR family protein n=1 Tax=Prunus dulcis TaxID=3755 RepID=A0A4Y1RC35_PRUDU|nr:disease resistance family protein / LRR family protein [Prunus dulcis]
MATYVQTSNHNGPCVRHQNCAHVCKNEVSAAPLPRASPTSKMYLHKAMLIGSRPFSEKHQVIRRISLSMKFDYRCCIQQSLRLSSNKLMRFPNLRIISLAHNQFEGPLPLRSTNASYFDLESNLFSGPIPSNFDKLMPKLKEMYLSENHLNGTIPPSVCNMQYLQVLSLRSNHFSGEFPHAWSSESHISIVDVAYNNLFGNIPTSMGVLTSLEILKLNNNNFGGKIPDSLYNCSVLKISILETTNYLGAYLHG